MIWKSEIRKAVEEMMMGIRGEKTMDILMRREGDAGEITTVMKDLRTIVIVPATIIETAKEILLAIAMIRNPRLTEEIGRVRKLGIESMREEIEIESMREETGIKITIAEIEIEETQGEEIGMKIVTNLPVEGIEMERDTIGLRVGRCC